MVAIMNASLINERASQERGTNTIQHKCGIPMLCKGYGGVQSVNTRTYNNSIVIIQHISSEY